jgi:hypothetical protein
MSINNFRSAQALYLVIVREKNADQLLKTWSKQHNCTVSIENNRMKIYDAHQLALFQVNWPHSWNNVTIWDYWNRRHITGD